jgi:anti-sigma regulatory factor (Ser/Thr protein kinase)
MTPAELTYDLLDDLILADERGRRAPVRVSVGPSLGPTVELLLFSLAHGDVIDVAASAELNAARACLSDGVPVYLRERTLAFAPAIRPFVNGDDVHRDAFMFALHKAMLNIGMPSAFIAGLVGALGEMESNIHEHSGAAATGIMAYSVTEERVEWIVADRGTGILSGLNASYPRMTDAGEALKFALSDGGSRLRIKGRGLGFRELFKALAARRASLRFRSDDQLLTIKGVLPDLSRARLQQRAHVPGFSVRVVCPADGW